MCPPRWLRPTLPAALRLSTSAGAYRRTTGCRPQPRTRGSIRLGRLRESWTKVGVGRPVFADPDHPTTVGDDPGVFPDSRSFELDRADDLLDLALQVGVRL